MAHARAVGDANLVGGTHQASRATLLPATCFKVSPVSFLLALIFSHDWHTFGDRLVS